MSARTAGWLAWSLWLLCAALEVVNGVLNGLEPASLDPFLPRLFLPWVAAQFALTALAFPTVGALIAARQPGNPIGWLLCGFGLSDAVRATASSYARYAVLAQPGSLPAGEWAAWLAWTVSGPAAGLLVLALLLFPDGHLVSRRWRPVAWLVGGASAAAILANALSPESPSSLAGIGRPVGLGGPAGGAVQAFSVVLQLLQVVLLLAAGLALVVRFRRSRGAERQQIKWVALTGALAAIVLVAFWLPGGWDWAARLGDWEYLVVLPYGLAGVAIPAAIGVAILRYQLYDIDLLINRTLVYGILTAGLGLLYWGGVIVLQQVLRPLTQGSELAIIGSTLAIAALFQPARSRIQAAVDRRFYRRKYDATQTLAAFSATLRTEVDLDSLARELLTVVRQTLQPDRASLWLQPHPGQALVDLRAPNSIARAVTIPERSPATTDSA